MMSGMCKKIKTKSCQFSHVMPKNCEEHNPSLTGGKRCQKAGCTLRHPRLCFHHLRGGCFFGEKCLLYHSQHTHPEDMKRVNDQQVNALINKIEQITRELDNLRSEFQEWKAELSEEPRNKKPPDPALSINVDKPAAGQVMYVVDALDDFETDWDTDGEDVLWHSDAEAEENAEHERGYGGDAVKEPGMDRGTEESLLPQERYDAIMCVVNKNQNLSDTEAGCDSDYGDGGYALSNQLGRTADARVRRLMSDRNKALMEYAQCLKSGCNCLRDRHDCFAEEFWVCRELKEECESRYEPGSLSLYPESYQLGKSFTVRVRTLLSGRIYRNMELSECLKRGCGCVRGREDNLDRLWVCKELKKKAECEQLLC